MFPSKISINFLVKNRLPDCMLTSRFDSFKVLMRVKGVFNVLLLPITFSTVYLATGRAK